MAIIKFKIDEKSLYYGTHNDFENGQTATVSTPINQATKTKNYRKHIMGLYPYSLDCSKLPSGLVEKCLKKTTSKANSELSYFFKFDKFRLDNKDFDCDFSFGMYVKTETDETIINRKGIRVKNTHKGREKLHYPTTFSYKTDGFKIDNELVLKKIAEINGGFAFVINGFEYNTETKILNFITSMVGLEGILLSTVFRRKKGVGKKLLIESIDWEAQDFSIASNGLISNSEKVKTPSEQAFEALNRTRIENGKLGEKYVYDHISDIFGKNVSDAYHASKDYPTSPYDIEYMENGTKKYIEVKSTSTDKKIFNMSSGEIKFMNKYKENYALVLVSNVKDKFPKINIYTPEQIMGMNKSYPQTVFRA